MRYILKTFPVFVEVFKRAIAAGIPFQHEATPEALRRRISVV